MSVFASETPGSKPRSRQRSCRFNFSADLTRGFNASEAPESFWLQSVYGAPTRARGALMST
eukprot:15075764-Alexandrium_andersonii.AAC.1